MERRYNRSHTYHTNNNQERDDLEMAQDPRSPQKQKTTAIKDSFLSEIQEGEEGIQSSVYKSGMGTERTLMGKDREQVGPRDTVYTMGDEAEQFAHLTDHIDSSRRREPVEVKRKSALYEKSITKRSSQELALLEQIGSIEMPSLQKVKSQHAKQEKRDSRPSNSIPKLHMSKIDPNFLRKTNMSDLSKLSKRKKFRAKTFDPRLKAGLHKSVITKVKTKLNQNKKKQQFRFKVKQHRRKGGSEIKRGFQWTEQSMIFQVLLIFLVIFIFYFSLLSLTTFWAIDLFTEKTSSFVNMTITEQATIYCQEVLQSVVNQQKINFEIERQLIKQASLMLQPLLDDKGDQFQLDWQATAAQDRSKLYTAKQIISQDEEQNKNLPGNKYDFSSDNTEQRQIDRWGYFPTIGQQNTVFQYQHKLRTLSHDWDTKDWWHQTLKHGDGLVQPSQGRFSLSNQMYLWIDDFQNSKDIYQYPVTRQRQALDKVLKEPYQLSQLVTDSINWATPDREITDEQNLPPIKRYEKFKVSGFDQEYYYGYELINYSGYDIATQKNRVSQISQPIEVDQKWRGSIVWEEDLNDKFKEIIVPQSLKSHGYPFIQVRVPQHPDFIFDADGKKSNHKKFPDINITYLQKKINSNEDDDDSGWIDIEVLETIKKDYKETPYDPAISVSDGILDGFEKSNDDKLHFTLCKSIPKQEECVFDQKFPLGEIIYQNNEDPLLVDKSKEININENPEFIHFINKIQENTFNSEEDDKIRIHRNFNMTYKDEEKNDRFKLFKFFGQNVHYEADQQEFANEGRSTASYNLLVFIIMDVDISQDILKKATTNYLDNVVNQYKTLILGINLGFTLGMGFLICFLIYYLVLWPIQELSEKMTNQQDRTEIDKYVQKINRKAKEKNSSAYRQFKKVAVKQIKKSDRMEGMHQFIDSSDEEVEEIDEIQQLRVLFSQFFLTYSKSITEKQQDITDQLTKLKGMTRSKMQKRNSLMIQQQTNNKLVMIINENVSKNQQIHTYQFKHIQRTRQYETMIRQEMLNMETHSLNGVNYKKDPMKKDWAQECDSGDEFNRQETANKELESSYTTSDEYSRSQVFSMRSARNHLTGSIVRDDVPMSTEGTQKEDGDSQFQFMDTIEEDSKDVQSSANPGRMSLPNNRFSEVSESEVRVSDYNDIKKSIKHVPMKNRFASKTVKVGNGPKNFPAKRAISDDQIEEEEIQSSSSDEGYNYNTISSARTRQNQAPSQTVRIAPNRSQQL